MLDQGDGHNKRHVALMIVVDHSVELRPHLRRQSVFQMPDEMVKYGDLFSLLP